MADTVIGKALRNDLVRQTAAHACDRDDVEDLLRKANLSRICHQAQTQIDNAAAFQVRTAANATAGNHRHSRAFKNLAFAQRDEASARLHGEGVGGRCTRSSEIDWESMDALPTMTR